MSKKKEQGPVGRTKRFFKLAGMTASVAAGYAGTKVRSAFQNKEDKERSQSEAHSKSGERIAKTLGELKGAVMKIGQMASVAADVLPRELAEALGSLQQEAPPMPYNVIAQQIEAELGAPPEMLYKSFDREPFAAASIGQVHRAVTDDDREVVVKIQYPGVDRSCDSDLAHLKLALKASGIVRMPRKQVNALFEEIRERLHEELDYCNEADNVRLFREIHANDDFVVLPKVIGERSAQRVLTLTYEPGDRLSQIDEKDYDQETRDQIGRNIFNIVCKQIFDKKILHADPNPGNFAFRPDGRVVLYDFGCVKHLKPEVVSAYRDILTSGIAEDYLGVEKGLLGVGARNPNGPPIDPEYYKDWRDLFLTPFLQAEPFDYGTSKLHDEVIKRVPGVMKRLRSFQPPVELIFIDRVIAGQYGTLRKVKSRGHFLEILEPFLALEQAKYTVPGHE